MIQNEQESKTSAVNRPVNVIIALAIIVALVGGTWWLGEKNGWADIGTGGSNAKLLPKVGDEAPEFFTLGTMDGESYFPMQLSQFRGQPVWLNFWGSWCPPCRAEMPEFIQAYDELSGQGIVILPISVGESPEQSMQYRDVSGGTFPIYMDPTYISAFVNADDNPELAAKFEGMRSDWQIKNYPTHVFIDADGIVRQIVLAQMSEDEMIAAATALQEPVSLLPPAVVTRYE